MFMFIDEIFVSMSKTHRRNDTVGQQERSRHLRPYLPGERIHHRFGHFTLWRAYILAMLCVHHYIVSPPTMFRVLWRTHFQKSSLTTFMFFLSIGYLCVGMYYLGVCVYSCVHMEVRHIFFDLE
jgi:hypothetical protein